MCAHVLPSRAVTTAPAHRVQKPTGMSRLAGLALVFAASACMNAPGSTGTDGVTGEPIQVGHLVVSVHIACNGETAFVQAQTTAPVDELELRAYPVAKTGEFGRVYEDRTAYPLEPLLRAPGATTYPFYATVPLGGLTCDDFKASMENVRAVLGARTESLAVTP